MRGQNSRPCPKHACGHRPAARYAFATMNSKLAARVFVFKVALKGQKRIWRRLAIRGDQTLDDLHEAIYDAFDRDDEHLYSFYFLKPGARGRDRLAGAIEFAHPYAAKDAGAFADGPVSDASQRTIASLKLKQGQTFE